MPLPTFLQRFLKRAEPAAASKPGKAAAKAKPRGAAAEPASSSFSGPQAAVQAARVQARRRLVGALVLLLLGIVGFPLVFETQPRPVAVDIPIVTPQGSVQPGAVAAAPTAAPRQPLPPSVVVESPVDAPTASQVALAAASAPAAAKPAVPIEIERELPPAKPSAKASAAVEGKTKPAEPKLAEAKPAEPKASAAAAAVPPKPAASRATLKPPPDDGTRARALLDDKPAANPPVAAAAPAASSPKTGRFVVQVGAYTDAAALRDARQKVEKLGLKTYTQVVVGGDAGKRTRVRVGPFENREEAERTAARVKAQGLPTAILAL